MSDNLLLPIELTKILYSEWEGQLEIASGEDQLYGKSLNGPCKVTFKNGNKYNGQFTNGLLHGTGVFIWANGIVYEGEFKHNKLQGKGTYRWPDGAVYQGEVQNGLRHGKGKLTLDMCTYEGQWKNGQRSGYGKIIFSNGGIYDGQFKNGVKCGKGKMYYVSGNYYEGEWDKDAKNGQGTMRWVDCHEKYTGQWMNNLQHGFGTHIWLDGRGQGKYLRNRYQGEWKAGLRDGLGVFYYANGSKYQGEWVQNMKQGVALFTNQLGVVQKALFTKDRQVKEESQSTTRLDDKTKSSFVFNNKEVEANPYVRMFDLRQLYLPYNGSLQQMYNLLLRSNSQLKAWYKNLSVSYDSKSELTFSLNQEGVWKIVRNLKVLGRVSLARVDRMLAKSKPDLRRVIQTLKGVKETVPVSQIQYYVQSTNTTNMIDSLDKLAGAETKVNELTLEIDIHDGQSIVLLRDFVYVLIVIAFMLDKTSLPHKSLEKLLDRVGPILDSMSKVERKNTAQSRSQNISSASKTEKNIPAYARAINVNLFNLLTQRLKSTFKFHMQDRCIQFARLIQIFKEADMLNDTTDVAMLQRFLDKNMDPEFLLVEPKFDTKLNPKLVIAGDYQLIEFQFVQLIFYYLIKKLPSTKQTDENKQKYTEFINKISDAYRSIQHKRLNRIHQNTDVRVNISSKLRQKEKLVENRKTIDKLRREQNAVLEDLAREEKERMEMEGNDCDVQSQHFESEEDLYSDY